MNIQKIEITQLKPAEYNPRADLQPEDIAYQKIKRSIEQFGYVDPVIINADNTVIGGHQRLKVLKDLGYTEIDVIVVNLDKEHEKALNIALNKITGEWDNDKLTRLLNELATDAFDISAIGFDEFELDALLSSESYIDDLLNDDFVTNNSEAQEFDVTFTLPIEYKPDMNSYIKENGKLPIVDMIINKIKGLM